MSMKNWGFYGILVLLILAGDRFAGHILQKQTLNSQFRFSKLYQNRAAADFLLLGNSRGLGFYQPYIEQITGKTSFNLSYNGLPMDVANALVQDYLERYPAPKTLLIDITLCDRENDALLAGFLPYTHASPRLDALIRHKLPKMYWGGKVSTLFRFNHEVFQRAVYYRNKPDTDWLLDRVIPDALAQEVAQNTYDLEINPYLLEQLQETVAAAQTKCKVVLLIGPYFPGFLVKNLDALKADVEKTTGLRVHDYRAALHEQADFGDFMHPNKKGSAKYLDILQRDGHFD